MALPQPLEHFMKRPGMYVSPVEFAVVAGFLQGLHVATGVLTGFREWLVVKLGYGNNLAWPALALRLIFPDAESPGQELLQDAAQRQAVESCSRSLKSFGRSEDQPKGCVESTSDIITG